jgi:hypothetical protein
MIAITYLALIKVAPARGAAYEFVLNHVVDVDSPTDMFRLEMEPSHDC